MYCQCILLSQERKTYRLDYSATFYYSDGTNETISNSQYKNT